MFALWVKFFELATVEERLFCLGSVEWEDLGSLRQIFVGDMLVDVILENLEPVFF